MNCDKCLHTGVCSYEESSRSLETKIKAAEAESMANNLVIFSCKHFKMRYQRLDKKED